MYTQAVSNSVHHHSVGISSSTQFNKLFQRATSYITQALAQIDNGCNDAAVGSLLTLLDETHTIEDRLDMSNSSSVIPSTCGDGLFNDIRNHITLVKCQVAMGKNVAAKTSLTRMQGELKKWKHRVEKGEPWRVMPYSMM